MIEVGIAACSSMESFEFGDVLFAVGLIVGAIGLRALMLAYLGTLAFRLPRRGRPLTVAFTKAIPLSILAWLVIGLTLALASEQTDVTFQGTCKLPGDYSLMVVDADGSGWVYKAGNEIKGGDVKWQRDGIGGVENLQIAGRYILGGRDSRGFRPSRDRARISEYFLIDSARETVSKVSTLPQLQASASQLGISVQLSPVYEVYSNCGDLPAARKDLKREDVRPRRVLVGTIFLLAIGFIYLLIR